MKEQTKSERIVHSKRQSAARNSIPGMKVCSGCLALKPLDDFHPQKDCAQGRRPRCIECMRAYSATRSRTDERREQVREYERRRPMTEDRRQGRIRSAQAFRDRHPEKATARRLVRNAIADGTLTKPETCSECGIRPAPMRDGRSSIQAHHDDYSKPLDVRWLCAVCHSEHHRSLTGGQDDAD